MLLNDEQHIPQANTPGKFRGDDDSEETVEQTSAALEKKRQSLIESLQYEQDQLNIFAIEQEET